MVTKKEQEIEDRLLRKQELEDVVQKASFELAQLIEKEVSEVKPKQIEADFQKLKFKEVGGNLIESEAFSKRAIYDYLNEKENTITAFNGLQAQTVFGNNDKKWEQFGKLELGEIYRVPGEFTLKFRHYEVN